MGDVLRDALEFPTRGDGWIKRLLIGGGLTLASGLLVVPSLFLYGYLYRVIYAATHQQSAPPEFSDWKGLFFDGLKVFLVLLVYSVVPLVLVAIGAVAGTYLLVLGPIPEQVGTVLTVVGVVGGAAVVFGAYYLLPAALAGLVSRGSLASAFNRNAVVRVARNREYFVGVLVAFLVGLVGALIASLLSLVLVGFVLQFYVQVVVFSLFGEAARRSIVAQS